MPITSPTGPTELGPRPGAPARPTSAPPAPARPVTLATPVRIACLAAPLSLSGYGVIRLLDGLDGEHGPGLAWTSGHLLFLVSLPLFAVTALGLSRLVPPADRVRRIVAVTAAVGTLVGLAAFARVVVLDIATGLQASDHAEMRIVSNRYDDDPPPLPAGFYDAFDMLGPALFQLGLLTLVLLLVGRPGRRLPRWSPVSLVAGWVALGLNLDLLPLGGVLLAAALMPLARRPRAIVATDGPRECAAQPAAPPR